MNYRTADGQAEMDAWLNSAECSAWRRTRTILILAVLIPSLVTVGLLIRSSVAVQNEADNALGLSADALFKSGDAKKAEISARSGLAAAEASLRKAELSSRTSPQYRKQLAKLIDLARADVSRAADRTRNADDRRESIWRNEVATRQKVEETASQWFLYLGPMTAALIALGLTLGYLYSEKRRAFNNRTIIQSLTESPSRAENPLDLKSLWVNNRERLQLYHQLVLNYAASTRQTTLVTLLAGFTFLLTAGAVATFVNTVASAVVISVVSTVGAAVTGFVARAVLKNADTSSREVLAFFAHPLEVERMLTAERVIEDMPEQARPDARLLIVEALTRNSLGVNRSPEESK
ncbi:hypothetical protein [Planotetraspora sp. GP83]|uniref:hypothetical protein n=1 Tax=Planotetraspora sp. GP83 TaxID=3156264 RepID=UPI0035154C1F